MQCRKDERRSGVIGLAHLVTSAAWQRLIRITPEPPSPHPIPPHPMQKPNTQHFQHFPFEEEIILRTLASSTTMQAVHPSFSASVSLSQLPHSIPSNNDPHWGSPTPCLKQQATRQAEAFRYERLKHVVKESYERRLIRQDERLSALQSRDRSIHWLIGASLCQTSPQTE